MTLAAANPLTEEQLTEVARAWRDLTAARKALQKEVDALEVDEGIARDLIIDQLRKSGSNIPLDGKVVKLKPVAYKPHVLDWQKVWDYVYEHRAFSLLHRRLTESAVLERWGDGQIIPGVEKFPVYSLSVTTDRS